MTAKFTEQHIDSNVGRIYYSSLKIDSGNSPRVNGRLALQQNGLTVERNVVRSSAWSESIVVNGRTYSYEHNSQQIQAMQNALYWDQSLKDDLVRSWYNSQGGFASNVGELYATRQQTVDMVTKTARRIYHAYRAARRFDWRGICSHLGISIRRPRGWRGKHYTPDQLWLEYVYGWKPLIQDVYNLSNAKFRNPRNKCIKTKHLTITASAVVDNSSGFCTVRMDNTTRVVLRATGTVVMSNGSLATASQLGITNPASLAWELLPFSFVVDWFIGIGPYLEQLTALAGFDVIEASTSTSVSYDFSSTGYGHPQSNDGWYISGEPTRSGSYTFKTRTPGIPKYPLPTLQNPVSLGHFANAMSLLTGLLRRSPTGSKRLT